MELFSVTTPDGSTVKVADYNAQHALAAVVAFDRKLNDKKKFKALEASVVEKNDLLQLDDYTVDPAKSIPTANPVAGRGIDPSPAELLELVSYAGRHHESGWAVINGSPSVVGMALCVCQDPTTAGMQHRRIVEIGNGKDAASLETIAGGNVFFAPGVPMFPALVWINPRYKAPTAAAPETAPVVSPPASTPAKAETPRKEETSKTNKWDTKKKGTAKETDEERDSNRLPG